MRYDFKQYYRRHCMILFPWYSSADCLNEIRKKVDIHAVKQWYMYYIMFEIIKVVLIYRLFDATCGDLVVILRLLIWKWWFVFLKMVLVLIVIIAMVILVVYLCMSASVWICSMRYWWFADFFLIDYYCSK